MSFSRRKFFKTGLLSTIPLLPFAGVNARPKEASRKLPKISLNTFSFDQLLMSGQTDLMELIDYCVENNFDAIDPTGYYFPGYPEAPSDEYIKTFKQKAFRNGIEISGSGIRNDFTLPDKKLRSADIDLIRRWCVVCQKMGCPLLRVFTGKYSEPRTPKSQVNTWLIDDFKTCAEIGEEHGILMALQNHNDYVKTADEVIEILEAVSSEWFGLHLDIGSFDHPDPYSEIAKVVKYALTFQIKEHVWTNGERVQTDYEKLMPIILKSGYKGYLPLEILKDDPYKKLPIMKKQVEQAIANFS
ncbi:MAG: sugar phosphate isomerase/epimerase [Cyclobacteriaceae bacterium]